MNSDSSSWAPEQSSAPEFVAAWRHVRGLFRAQNADNVRFVWAPAAVDNGVVPIAFVYPGGDFVDAVGMTVFNGGDALPWGGWKSFEELHRDTRSELARLAPDEDVIYASVASTEHGGDKAEWIRSMFRTVRTDPNAVALIWFDHDKETNWRADSSEAALTAVRDEVASARGG
jgi:mannan endo-1,4-beta-mannosidase